MMTFCEPPPLLTKKEFEEKYKPYKTDSYPRRVKYIDTRGWGVVTDEQAAVLSVFLRGKTVIEVCSGTGFLAAHLRNKGVKNYLAFDNFSLCFPSSERVNYGSVNRNIHSVTIAKAEAIVMCWPNYDSNLAERVVKKMRKGQYLIYQGEGHGGCTGNSKFFKQILNENKFQEMTYLTEKLNSFQARWCGLHDYFMVYKKLTNR